MTRLSPLSLIFPLLAAFMAGWGVRDLTAERDRSQYHAAQTQALADAVRNARTIEQQFTATLADIGEHHAEQQIASPGLEADIMSALRTGTVRLRREWQHCETRRVSELAAATAERDAATADRDALAAAIVRAGYDADAQLAACQAVIRAYRQPAP